MANVAHYSFRERSKLGWWTAGFVDIRTASTEDMIVALVRTLEKHSGEYLLYYALADHLQKAGLYAAAMEICKKIVELRPDDIRSPYVMATNYNCLTRASTSSAWISELDLELYFGHLTLISKDMLDSFVSKTENEKLGIDEKTAANEAIRWFKKTLILNPDYESETLLNQHLATLYKRYPDLRK